MSFQQEERSTSANTDANTSANLEYSDPKLHCIKLGHGPEGSHSKKIIHADIMVNKYLRKHEHVFRLLDDFREKVSKCPKVDIYFKTAQKASDEANDGKGKEDYYKIYMEIGKQLHTATSAFTSPDSSPKAIRALNLCMAPGGYTWCLLEANPSAIISGITLPPESGGHPMLLPYGEKDPRVEVMFMDITMLAAEFGASMSAIPSEHPEAAMFVADRPYQDFTFDIVLCDGQALRTHNRALCREDQEAFRLTLAQLILGMQRIKIGGTFIILLHRVDGWDSVKLLREFDSFSNIKLFKPKRIHGHRSSFYLVAKNVQPGHPEAIHAIEKWKEYWWKATFGGKDYTGEVAEDSEEFVISVLNSFGGKLVGLGKPLWRKQFHAMKKRFGDMVDSGSSVWETSGK